MFSFPISILLISPNQYSYTLRSSSSFSIIRPHQHCFLALPSFITSRQKLIFILSLTSLTLPSPSLFNFNDISRIYEIFTKMIIRKSDVFCVPLYHFATIARGDFIIRITFFG